MLTFNEARIIGIQACVNKLGYDFVRKNEELSCTAYGDEADHAFCFVGVGIEAGSPKADGSIVLDDSPERKFPFSASCNVDYADGTVTFLDCVLPQME